MEKTSTGETPFSLTYGTEAMIPAEVGLPTARASQTNEKDNETALRNNLDLLEERRGMAAIKETRYKKIMEKEYNKRVRLISYKVGDYVLRHNLASRAEPQGKLGPTWEGPYVIHEVLGKGAYKLSQLNGRTIPRSWNAAQLRKCYM